MCPFTLTKGTIKFYFGFRKGGGGKQGQFAIMGNIRKRSGG